MKVSSGPQGVKRKAFQIFLSSGQAVAKFEI